jgi:DmsE family decaheme c-type cytochrome
MTTGVRRHWPFILLAGAGLLAFTGSARAQEDCATCHEDVAKQFAKTNHGRQFAGNKAYGSANCVSCHVGAEEHAASGGEKKPPNLKKGPDASAPCLSCHSGKPKQAHWAGSSHERAGLACASCHAVHAQHGGTPEMAKTLPGPSEVTKNCVECHGGLRAALHQRSSHPLREGQMTCASCHNPHGAAGEKLIAQGSVNELCYSCHQNTRGPFLWEHSPVREDCLTCHRPHGSNYPQLLQARVTQLCQSCHQQGRHQTLPGVPASVWVSNRACLNCHQNIHGSNHPSGPLFQR